MSRGKCQRPLKDLLLVRRFLLTRSATVIVAVVIVVILIVIVTLIVINSVMYNAHSNCCEVQPNPTGPEIWHLRFQIQNMDKFLIS